MATITISSVTFSPAQTGTVAVIFSYKKTSDSVFINLNNGVAVTVPANGTLSTPIAVTGLLAATSYTFKAKAVCGTAVYEEVIVTPAATCPTITDIGITASSS